MFERMKERLPLIRPLLVPLVLYLGLLALALSWLEAHPESSWRYPVALAPMLPGLWIAWGLVRATRKLDELGRKILLEAMALSFCFTLVLTLSLGLLGIAGLPQLNAAYISLFMVVMLLCGKLLLTGKYQ